MSTYNQKDTVLKEISRLLMQANRSDGNISSMDDVARMIQGNQRRSNDIINMDENVPSFMNMDLEAPRKTVPTLGEVEMDTADANYGLLNGPEWYNKPSPTAGPRPPMRGETGVSAGDETGGIFDSKSGGSGQLTYEEILQLPDDQQKAILQQAFADEEKAAAFADGYMKPRTAKDMSTPADMRGLLMPNANQPREKAGPRQIEQSRYLQGLLGGGA